MNIEGLRHFSGVSPSRMTYAICMKRTTVFLPEDLELLLQETARRKRRPQAEIVREALAQYLHTEARPWPRSIGMGDDPDRSVTSENAKQWVREQWLEEREKTDRDDATTPEC